MPHPLKQRIVALRSRIRQMTIVYGVSLLVATVLSTVLLLGSADYLLRFQDQGIRLICSILVLAVAAWTSYRYLFLGLTVELPDVELAQHLQRQFPELGDTLASSIEFIEQPEDDPTAGSVSLRRAVIARTTAETDQLNFADALETVPLRRSAFTAAAICLTALILVVLGWPSSRIAVARLINPLGDVSWPQTYHLALWRQVAKVARGQVFELEVVDQDGQRLPSNVKITYRFDNPEGSVIEETQAMQLFEGPLAARGPDGKPDPRRQNGVMVARRENVTRSFSYRVQGGDDRSMPWTRVEVLEPPAVESLSVKLVPPEYTAWRPRTANGEIRALIGTQAAITATSTKPLKSAMLCLEGGPRVEAQLADESGRRLTVDFVVQRSGSYWLRLTDVEGLTGVDNRWDIRAIPDFQPTVSIEQPASNIYVTPQAVIPLRVAVKDDLAVRRVDLQFARSDSLEGNDPLPLYVGPDRAEPRPGSLSGDAQSGENRVVAYRWDLTDLKLQPGLQVTFHATAGDYQPRQSKSDPLRLSIITPEELAERIAARQATIIEELSSVVQMQQQSRRQVADLDIQLGELGLLNQLDVDHLRGAELNQRQVNRTLTSPSEGVVKHALGLLADLDNNKIDSSDVRRQMRNLLGEIDRLETELLPMISRELTAAIKTAQVQLQDRGADSRPSDDSSLQRETDAAKRIQPDPALVAALGAAGKHQDQVITALESLLEKLGRWDRYRRFHSLVRQLLRHQEELTQRSTEVGRQTLTKDLKDLLPQELADLKVLAQRQFDLSRDLDKIQQGMERAAAEMQEGNPLFAEIVSDALYRAKELAISGQMHSAGGSLQRNQMGQAIQQQRQIEAGLEEILDILANRQEHELARLIRQLLGAETELAEMSQREEDLQGQIEQSNNLPEGDQRRGELDRIGRDQETLRQDTQRMSRQLERLMAESAGRTTARAADKMQQARKAIQEGDVQTASGQAEGAKKDLDDALQQVTQRRLQAEMKLASEQVSRLQETLQSVRKRQATVLDETLQLDQFVTQEGQLNRTQAANLQAVARDQKTLQTDTNSLIEQLVGAEVFNLALSGVSNEMARAAQLLAGRQTGPPTQQAERGAIRRLDQMLEALQPEEPLEEPEDPGDSESQSEGAGAPEGQGSPPGGTQTLAELKLLKLMQEEVNARTKELAETHGPPETLTDETRREYLDLSRQQGRLADLLLNLIWSEENAEGSP